MAAPSPAAILLPTPHQCCYPSHPALHTLPCRSVGKILRLRQKIMSVKASRPLGWLHWRLALCWVAYLAVCPAAAPAMLPVAALCHRTRLSAQLLPHSQLPSHSAGPSTQPACTPPTAIAHSWLSTQLQDSLTGCFSGSQPKLLLTLPTAGQRDRLLLRQQREGRVL